MAIAKIGADSPPLTPAGRATPERSAKATTGAPGGQDRPKPDSFQRADAAARATPPALLSPAEADAFMAQVIDRERPFYQPGAGYDAKTGVTFDGETIDFATAAVTGHHAFSAASKESLHVGLLVKALEGEPAAQRLLTPDPSRPAAAVDAALKVLTDKITTYERFDHDHPGFGGFLPWYSVEDGRIVPNQGWENRVPSLDNGELAWALYAAAHVLRDTGHPELAARYQARVDEMARNAVRIFYDPGARKLRAEAKIVGGDQAPPERTRYESNVDSFLDDACEGLLMCHFADLFGDWTGLEAGRDAIWAQPRREPIDFVTTTGRHLTTVKGNWFSSHEEWGFAFLPFRDLPVADQLFRNAQTVRTSYSAERHIPGLFASTTKPVRSATEPGGYEAALGVPPVAKFPSESQTTVAPYAAFPLALVDKPMFATWLKAMLEAPRMWGPQGIGESFDTQGDAFAPVLTWDGKALEMLAWMGGMADETRRFLQRDGKYDALMARVAQDYRRFAGRPIEGLDLPLAAPTAGVPRRMPDFAP